jgi:4-hydroxybenzoate polyprenyltransferase
MFNFWLKAARPGLWAVALWFYLLPLGDTALLRTPLFWAGALYVTFPFGLLLYAWNDLSDRATDRANPRKDSFLFGARGTDRELATIPWTIVATQIPFAIFFCGWRGPLFLLWLLGALVANTLYNRPPVALKNRPVGDVLAQSAYLLVFVLSSWINRRPPLPWTSFVFGALFAMHSHLFGQILDIEPDRAAGRRTTAVAVGRRPAKLMLTGFLVFESIFIFFAFHTRWLSLSLAMGAGLLVLDNYWIFKNRAYPDWLMKAFMLLVNAVAVASIPWVWRSGLFRSGG